MKKMFQVLQFLHGTLICTLPSLAAIGNLAAGTVCALLSPLFCTLILPICKRDRRLWLFIWTTMAMTGPDLLLIQKIAPALSALLHGALQPEQLNVPLFILLYTAQQLLFYGVLRLMRKHRKDADGAQEKQEKENPDVL